MFVVVVFVVVHVLVITADLLGSVSILLTASTPDDGCSFRAGRAACPTSSVQHLF